MHCAKIALHLNVKYYSWEILKYRVWCSIKGNKKFARYCLVQTFIITAGRYKAPRSRSLVVTGTHRPPLPFQQAHTDE